MSKQKLEIEAELAQDLADLETRIQTEWRVLPFNERQSIWSKSASQRWGASSEHSADELKFSLWKKAADWLYNQAPDLTEDTLLKLNQKILDLNELPTYRSEVSENEVIKFAKPDKIKNEVKRVLDVVNGLPKEVKTAAFLIQELLTIHPFKDGNGRTLRLFLDLYLIKSNYPPPVYNTARDLLVANSHESAKQFSLEHSVLLLALALERQLDKTK